MALRNYFYFLILITNLSFANISNYIRSSSVQFQTETDKDNKTNNSVDFRVRLNALEAGKVLNESEILNKDYEKKIRKYQEISLLRDNLDLKLENTLNEEIRSFYEKKRGILSKMIRLVKPKILNGNESPTKIIELTQDLAFSEKKVKYFVPQKIEKLKNEISNNFISKIQEIVSQLKEPVLKNLAYYEYHNERFKYEVTLANEKRLIDSIQFAYDDRHDGFEKAVGVSFNIPIGVSYTQSKTALFKKKRREYQYTTELRYQKQKFISLKEEVLFEIERLLLIETPAIKKIRSLINAYKINNAKSRYEILNLEAMSLDYKIKYVEYKKDLLKKYMDLVVLSGTQNKEKILKEIGGVNV